MTAVSVSLLSSSELAATRKLCQAVPVRVWLRKPHQHTTHTTLHAHPTPGHTKSVHCCTWNSMLKVIASGSADRRVMLWNPFSCRALGALSGHSAPVVALVSNEREMQIMSAAADNTVKVCVCARRKNDSGTCGCTQLSSWQSPHTQPGQQPKLPVERCVAVGRA